MVYKKVQKGKVLEVIVDELEGEIAAIRPIYEAVKAMGDGFDCDEVYKQISQNK